MWSRKEEMWKMNIENNFIIFFLFIFLISHLCFLRLIFNGLRITKMFFTGAKVDGFFFGWRKQSLTSQRRTIKTLAQILSIRLFVLAPYSLSFIYSVGPVHNLRKESVSLGFSLMKRQVESQTMYCPTNKRNDMNGGTVPDSFIPHFLSHHWIGITFLNRRR